MDEKVIIRIFVYRGEVMISKICDQQNVRIK